MAPLQDTQCPPKLCLVAPVGAMGIGEPVEPTPMVDVPTEHPLEITQHGVQIVFRTCAMVHASRQLRLVIQPAVDSPIHFLMMNSCPSFMDDHPLRTLGIFNSWSPH